MNKKYIDYLSFLFMNNFEQLRTKSNNCLDFKQWNSTWIFFIYFESIYELMKNFFTRNLFNLRQKCSKRHNGVILWLNRFRSGPLKWPGGQRPGDRRTSVKISQEFIFYFYINKCICICNIYGIQLISYSKPPFEINILYHIFYWQNIFW